MLRGLKKIHWPSFLHRYRTEGVLTVLLFIGYLPMTGLLMGLKNDALKVSYPIYRFMSEAIRSGNIPWWHYNLQFGFPLHADPGSLFWNPMLWVFSFMGSTLDVYTYFIWFHVLIGAIGFFRLMRFLGTDDFSGVCFAFLYVFSGYYVAHIQHPNYLIGCAWIPWVLLFSFQILFRPRWIFSAGLAVSLYFLVNSGYPAFPVGMAYFMLLLLPALFIQQKRFKTSGQLLKSAAQYLLAVVLSLLMSLPYLVSLMEVLPFYYRAEAASIAVDFFSEGGMNGSSLVALLFPLPTGVEGTFWGTDISWINVYTGSLVFLLTIVLLIRRRWSDLWPYYITGLFFLLISLQGFTKSFFLTHLPLLGYFRNNGVFSVFLIVTQLLLVAPFFQSLPDQKLHRLQRLFASFMPWIYGATGIAVLVLLYDQYGMELITQWQITWKKSHFISKEALLLFNCAVMLVVWVLFRLLPFSRRTCLQLIVLDVYLNFLLCLPLTGLGIYSTSSAAGEIDQWLKEESRQKAKTGEWRMVTADKFPSKYVAHPAFYFRSPAMHDLYAYPSVFRNVVSLWNVYEGQLPAIIKPARFMQDTADLNKVLDISYTPASMKFELKGGSADTLLVAQNHYPHWKLESGIGTSIIYPFKSPDGFMAVPVGAGKQTIRLVYDPVSVKNSFWMSIAGWFICFAFILHHLRNRSKGSAIFNAQVMPGTSGHK